MRQTFLSKTFANSLNMQKQFEKIVWEKSNVTYLLSATVQTTINHISIVFYHNINVKEKRELKEALRDTLTRAVWYGLLFTTAN